jgi:hypothetical protein
MLDPSDTSEQEQLSVSGCDSSWTLYWCIQIHPFVLTVTDIQRKRTVKHNTLVPHNNVLCVLVHQNNHQAPLLQKFRKHKSICNIQINFCNRGAWQWFWWTQTCSTLLYGKKRCVWQYIFFIFQFVLVSVLYSRKMFTSFVGQDVTLSEHQYFQWHS